MGGKPSKQPPLAAPRSSPAVHSSPHTPQGRIHGPASVKKGPGATKDEAPGRKLSSSVSPSTSDESYVSTEDEAPSKTDKDKNANFSFTVEEFRAAPRVGAMKGTRSAPQLADRKATKAERAATMSALLAPDYPAQLIPKKSGYDRVPQFNERELEGVWLPDQQWSDACRDSLRRALLIQSQTDTIFPESKSAPSSLDKLEVLRSTLPKNEVARHENRRNSILSSLNVQLDVIPERVEDEKENPDDYEYSDMNVYF